MYVLTKVTHFGNMGEKDVWGYLQNNLCEVVGKAVLSR